MSCDVVTDRKQILLISAYLTPSTLEHLLDLWEALTRFWNQSHIVLGDPNSDIGQAQNPWSQQLLYLLMGFGLVELLRHFWHCWWFRNLNMWYQVRQGRLLWERCNYILGTYFCCFKIVGIWDVRDYSSDHFALQSRLLQQLTQCRGSYLWRRCAFPLSLPTPEKFRLTDRKFQELKAFKPTPPPPNLHSTPPMDVGDINPVDW